MASYAAAKTRDITFVDPYWSDERAAKIVPYSFIVTREQELVDIADIGDTGGITYHKVVAGMEWLRGEFTTPLMLGLDRERWLIIDGEAVCRIRIVEIHPGREGSLDKYVWTSVGKVWGSE